MAIVTTLAHALRQRGIEVLAPTSADLARAEQALGRALPAELQAWLELLAPTTTLACARDQFQVYYLNTLETAIVEAQRWSSQPIFPLATAAGGDSLCYSLDSGLVTQRFIDDPEPTLYRWTIDDLAQEILQRIDNGELIAERGELVFSDESLLDPPTSRPGELSELIDLLEGEGSALIVGPNIDGVVSVLVQLAQAAWSQAPLLHLIGNGPLDPSLFKLALRYREKTDLSELQGPIICDSPNALDKEDLLALVRRGSFVAAIDHSQSNYRLAQQLIEQGFVGGISLDEQDRPRYRIPL